MKFESLKQKFKTHEDFLPRIAPDILLYGKNHIQRRKDYQESSHNTISYPKLEDQVQCIIVNFLIEKVGVILSFFANFKALELNN